MEAKVRVLFVPEGVALAAGKPQSERLIDPTVSSLRRDEAERKTSTLSGDA